MKPVREVVGRVVPLPGDDIDTDRIIPARFVKTSPYAELGRHVFADDRAAAPHPFDDPRYAGATVLVVGQNFGCGSSREHAVAALTGWGVRAVVGGSFSTIFAANALANGVPTAAVSDVDALMRTDAVVTVDVAASVVRFGGTEIPFGTGPGFRERLLAGTWDPLDRLLANASRTAAVAAALPYHSWPHPLLTKEG